MMCKAGGKIILLCIAAALLQFAGCGSPTKVIEQGLENKEACALEIRDVMWVTYDGTGYVILEETVPGEDVGTWVGYIRKLVGAGETGEVLFSEDFSDISGQTDALQKADVVVAFLNVYRMRGEKGDVLLVDVNGAYQKAVPEEAMEEEDEPLLLADLAGGYKTAGDFTVNPENGSQIVCGEAVYQVTDEEVSSDQLGIYLDCIAQRVVFDSDTKEIITYGELGKVDWTGEEEATRGRTDWLYTNVYEIQGTDKTSMVAVRVNGDYRTAKIRR